MYRAVTREIQVTVTPAYLAEQSNPDKGRYFWAYTVEIVNLGQHAVTLRSRYWQIRDSHGRLQEVRGDGVIGQQPRIEPGSRFEYTSGCPLETPAGIMSGQYQMQAADGGLFAVDIPAFSLDSPHAPRIIH
jgi:ApaG protein